MRRHCGKLRGAKIHASRLVCLLLIPLCLVLSACGGDGKDGQDTGSENSVPVDEAVKSAVLEYNKSDLRSTGFAFGITKEKEEGQLAFLQGTVSYRTGSHPVFSGRVTEVKNGKGSTADVYYKAGAYYRDSGEGKFYTLMDSDEAFGAFFCVDAFLPEGNADGFRTAQTLDGTKYVYTAGCTPEVIKLTEQAFYGRCGLKKPRRDRTEYGAAEYSYIIGPDGKLENFGISFDVSLLDTAPYYPAYSVPDEELTQNFSLTLEINCRSAGDSVVVETPDIKEYIFLG